jgi:cysteine-rich repeat protein
MTRSRSENRTVLRRIFPALLLSLLLAAPVGAVLIDSGDGSGNTTAPPDDPGFAYVGRKVSLTVIYVGYGWVLSAAHVGDLGTVVIGGVGYTPMSGTRTVLIQSGAIQADLELFRITTAPPLPPLPIRASTPALNDPVIMVGNGRDRGAAFSLYPPPSSDDGYYWETSHTLRWGTNVVDAIVPDFSPDYTTRTTHSFTTSFTRNGTADEAQGTNGDSGGAVFIENGGTWELAGVMHAIEGEPEQVGAFAETSVYGNLTYAADLSEYRTRILEIITPVCGNGYLTLDEQCDDGNTADGDCCSATCQLEAAGSPCDDGDACSDVDTCDAGGACVSGDPVVCDDGQFCNGLESCNAPLGCQPGTPPDPDDGVSCTVDGCDEASDSLVHTPDDALCDDGAFCNGAETCDALLDCQAGAPPDPDDAVSCTLDSCDEASDSLVHTPDDALCDDGDACSADRCDTLSGCAHEPAQNPACLGGIGVPAASSWGRGSLILLLLVAGALRLAPGGGLG